MQPYLARNRHFEELFADRELRWMGQNTNHLPPPPAVRQAMIECIESEEYHAYAPPAGFAELHDLIRADLDLSAEDAGVMVTNGAVEGLYHATRQLLRPGDRFITADPGWKWTSAFARAGGAEVVELSIYEPAQDYRLTPDQLRAAVAQGARMIYVIDPLNPLGVGYGEDEIAAFAAIAREADAFLVHDCTYRHFADRHTLARRFYPERTITTYSFSKWLGLAGLRLGALVARPSLLDELAQAQPNSLGSNVIAQRAAIAGLRTKSDWFPEVQRIQRENQARIREAALSIDGLACPIYPSQGNFLVIDCTEAGLRPEALCDALLADHVLIRHAGYHSARYAERFVKVSTTVPSEWAEILCARLAGAVDRARQAAEVKSLY